MPGLPAIAPRIVLADLPTPVTTLPDLAREAGLAELLVKRDDATSRLFGGTKVRSLEFFFGRALASGRTGVVTLGSAGSNHAVATATFARELGMTARAILHPHPDPEHVRKNLDLLASLDTDARTASWLRLVPTLVRGRHESTGGTRPLWIPPGGSSALGVLGAAEGALEVVEEAQAGRIRMPQVVVVAAGSCGTAAGLALGFALARASVRVVAVRVVTRLVANRSKILRLARGGLRILRRSGMAAVDQVVLGPVDMVHGEAGGGYAKPTAAAERAAGIATIAGIAAETTYTGKAWAHLLSGALSDRRVLFWNTFGGR